MYFPIGWPQTLSCSGNIHSIVANSDQSLFLFISTDHFSIWFCRPTVQIVHYQRTHDSIAKYGHNVSAVWKSDSSQIVIQTTENYLLFYQVIINDKGVIPIIETKSKIANDSVLEENKVPCLFLQLKNSLKIDEGITCIMSAEEDMVISTKTGLLCGIEWDGQPDNNFRFNISVPPNYYLKKEPNAHNAYHIIDFKYSAIIGGFSLVFSNGLGAFLPLNENTSSTYTQLQLISHVDNALCTAINHKYAFIVFGLISSDAIACDFDEVDRRFVISFRLSLPSNFYPDAEKILGPLTSFQWTPDSTVLATIWENGDFALWSVFGSLLSYSISWYNSLDIRNDFNERPFKISSLAFGKEGFHLWMLEHGNIQQKPAASNRVCKLSLVKSVLAANPCSSVSLESILLSSEDRIFVGGNKNSSVIAQNNKFDESEKSAQTELLKNEKLSNVILSEQESNAVDSFQWITIALPQSYLEANWPIRLFAIDPHTSQNIAVAGSNGFAMYSLIHRRWKFFGNENHEKDFMITGGFLWYYDHLISGCYNISDDCFEIRAYSHRNKLDNSNAKIILIEYEVQLLSLYQNRLLALCSNGTIYLFDLHLFKRNHHYSIVDFQDYDINISAPIRVVINNLEIFPDCVTSCLLTDLHVDLYHSSMFHHQPPSESISHRSFVIQNSLTLRSHSILINICGRVLLLEMDIDTSKLPFPSDDDEDEEINYDLSTKQDKNLKSIKNVHLNGKVNGSSTINFKKVVKLASNVENLWVLPHDNIQLNAFRLSLTQQRNSNFQLRPHLETSLYLSCGGHGMAIWLSLEHSIRSQYVARKENNLSINNENNKEHTYISKRIMLPLSEIGSSIYPLAIRFRDAIVLGAESDFTQPNLSFSSSQKNSQLFSLIPYFVVKRTSQVYLHYILRELLRRNLGYRAWEIANTCSTLPHFVHSLELLLHGVLEEEASSSQPIPDALLPRVVDFIRAFPVFLQTVIHCARKTELALWPHLFSIVGSPKDLFQQCLLEGQFDTASSYIIVLQNLEKPEVASKCASRLLQAARVAGCWITVKELKRFLRATNQAEENEITIKESEQKQQTRTRNDSIQIDKQQDDITKHSDPLTPTIHSPNLTFGQSNPLAIIYGTESPNVIKPNRVRHGPGAAMKSVNQMTKSDNISEKCFVEENVVMNETEEYNNHKDNSEDSSLSNFDDAPRVTDSNKSGPSNYIYCSRNTRAYPGTILRMTQDDANNISNTLKFLNISENSSTSSIVSSVSSSSTLSSASVSPIVHQNHQTQKPRMSHRPNFSTTIKSESNRVVAAAASASAEEIPSLRAISITNDHEQCIIS